jgi:4-amino-4-deoxy-L-arabinose transferase-like glycosyltransferase
VGPPSTRLYLSLITLAGFFLRIIHLNNLPLSLNLDEATNGLDALQLVRLNWLTPFLQNNFGRETLFFYLQGLALHAFGISFFSLRFPSVIAGTLAIPLVYGVGRRLDLGSILSLDPDPQNGRPSTGADSHLIGLLAAAGLAVSYWHLFFSRLGLRAILLPPLLLALIWCFWRGWPTPPKRTLRWRWLIAAGLLLGLTFYTYLAARLLPILFITFAGLDMIRVKPARRAKVTGLLIFGLVAGLVTLPLILYFQHHPQALASRTQAISILAQANPLGILAGNTVSLARLHFLAGAWLEQWPALDILSAAGLLVGLLACLTHFKKPAALFLLLWWVIGTTPVLFSTQDWTGQTTLLRGIIAWPALVLISAIGLVVLAGWLSNIIVRIPLFSKPTQPRPETPGRFGVLWLFLIVGGLTGAYHYFFTWATTTNRLSDHPAYLAQYLNAQADQLTLTPLKFYAETVTHFLLQKRYPALTNIAAAELHALLNSNRASVYLLPHDSPAGTGFVLLAPAANGRGTAYLAPPLSPAQNRQLAAHAAAANPLTIVLDGEQEPIAGVYPLPADLLLFAPPKLAVQTNSPPLPARFNDDVLLSSYRVEPAGLKPGETVTLTLYWQALRPIDGDYYLFIHLFDIQHEQRHGQINTPLTGLLFDAHHWPLDLTVPDIRSLTLPVDAPDGVYRFEVGLYHAASGQRLPVTFAAGRPAGDSVILGKLHVRQQPPAPPQHPLADVQFGQSIALLGVDLPPAPLQPGQVLTFTLHWQALAPIAQNYTVFTHLLDSTGTLQAQQDNAPLQGRYPTSGWAAGETIIDPYTLPLPATLAPGDYTLRVGLYLAETGRRLPLKNGASDFVDLPSSITIRN